MAQRFDPEKYEDVNERIKKFYADHSDGSLTTEIVEHTKEYVVVQANLWIEGGLRSTGFAQEFRIFERQKTSSGGTYEPVNMFNYIENAETSAIGRALANFNYSGTKERPSAQEMQKVDRMEGAQPIKPEPKRTRLDTEQVSKLMGIAKLKGLTTKEEAVAWLNMILNTDDFTQLDPAGFESYKKTISDPKLTVEVDDSGWSGRESEKDEV